MYKLSEKVDHLSKCPLFESIPYEELKLIAFTATDISYKEGEIVFEEGHEALEAFVILEGEAVVYKETSDRKEVILAELKKNDIFGEFAIISKGPRTAGVKVTKDLSGISINKETFLEILKEFPEVAIRIMDFLVRRLIKTEKRLVELMKMG